ncbi:hypothetical protein Caka_3106 [Coraliomargarita akajimensis DSM 45221]|uniref:Uncharacterized protein n=1 Tax=Coraliomargarita akajimensis (strain DSM 45221 / IAM 15411 / JCM 23193 / KCTC 12865 / 04OKA010-24) TaxID=583355 RepID=D5EI79_CORAD|nr:hypothetical protein Caka_3106 [Coraliomargarita akajimensis DSM 45221]
MKTKPPAFNLFWWILFSLIGLYGMASGQAYPKGVKIEEGMHVRLVGLLIFSMGIVLIWNHLKRTREAKESTQTKEN